MAPDNENYLGDMEKDFFNITVNIASDYLSATLTLEKFDKNVVVKKEDIIEALKKKNISFGVDVVKINDIIKSQVADSVVIAKGKPYVHGLDGEIRYNFDVSDKSRPEINEDGTVDFKNVHYLTSVKSGEILAEKTEPTKGETGTLVTGKMMKGRDGRIANFKIGKNVRISEDGLKAISEADGCIEIKDGRISVKNAIDIDGDVGLKTGNIDFNGKVNVRGNVLTGYHIKSTEDIVINGIVESAEIISDKDIYILGGVQGNDEARIEAGGNIISKFINNANVIAGGTIETDSILHCHMTAGDSVIAKGKKGLIVGGRVVANKNITARQIGTSMGTKTIIEVGLKPEFMKRLQDVQSSIKSELESYKKLGKVIELLEIQYESTKDASVLESINKTKQSREEYKNNLSILKEKNSDLEQLIDEMKESDVVVNRVFQGVRIKIASVFYRVDGEMLDVRFKKEGPVVKALSL